MPENPDSVFVTMHDKVKFVKDRKSSTFGSTEIKEYPTTMHDVEWTNTTDAAVIASSLRYVFRGSKVWCCKKSSDQCPTSDGFPKIIGSVFPRAPTSVEAAFAISNSVYLLKNEFLWRYFTEGTIITSPIYKLYPSFPMPIHQGLAAEGGRTFIIRHYSGLCAAVRPDQQLHLTSECKDKFRLTPTKSILHISSGRCITTDGNFLKLGNTCTDMFEQTASFSLKHVTSGKCLHPSGGSIQPAVNRFIVFADGCDQDRLQFKFDDFQYEISVQQGQDILSKNSEPMFFTSELNAKRRLIALNIASKYVESSKQCMEECLEFNTTKCQSINYAIKKGENGHMCELNAPINPNDVAKFIYDPRFVHYSLL